MQISLVLCTLLFFAKDECAEINLNATGNNRKTRLLLPRGPFPIPTISINVRMTTKRLTHGSDDLHQLVFYFGGVLTLQYWTKKGS